MMQDAGDFDHIEAAADGAEFKDVALRVFDAVRQRRRRLALGVTETAQAEIDREHPRALVSLRALGGLQAGPAAGDKDIERLGFSERRESGGRELVAHVLVERDRLDL